MNTVSKLVLDTPNLLNIKIIIKILFVFVKLKKFFYFFPKNGASSSLRKIEFLRKKLYFFEDFLKSYIIT
ncbi:hypothetical protein AMYT_2117 [Malaciobacter mytili LMG 24559]|nr:hypothetical protein AMYT_2117 [Malaciobacter mytili LMG 24559]